MLDSSSILFKTFSMVICDYLLEPWIHLWWNTFITVHHRLVVLFILIYSQHYWEFSGMTMLITITIKTDWYHQLNFEYKERICKRTGSPKNLPFDLLYSIDKSIYGALWIFLLIVCRKFLMVFILSFYSYRRNG